MESESWIVLEKKCISWDTALSESFIRHLAIGIEFHAAGTYTFFQ